MKAEKKAVESFNYSERSTPNITFYGMQSRIKASETEEGPKDLGRRMWRTGWGLVSGEWTNSRSLAGVCKICQSSNIRKRIIKREGIT